jgi:PilZ domain
MTMDSAERRNSIRYRVTAQAIFRWKTSRRAHYRGEGTTRDISVTGVYVSTATCPPEDSIIQIDVVLPPPFSKVKTRIKAEMKVLRVEHNVADAGLSGFSAVCNGFSYPIASNEP